MSRENAKWWREQEEREGKVAKESTTKQLVHQRLVRLVLAAEQRRLQRLQRVDAPYWREWQEIVNAAKAVDNKEDT